MVRKMLLPLHWRGALAIAGLVLLSIAANQPRRSDTVPPENAAEQPGKRRQEPSRRSAQKEIPQQGVDDNADIAASQKENGGRTPSIEHGKYLVHHVALCVICHTPKDRQGDLIETALLEGARIPVSSPYPMQEWALKAPHIAGLPGGWTEDALAHFLQTGETPTGFPIRPPMPPFRMNRDDAQDVAAYLHSLGVN